MKVAYFDYWTGGIHNFALIDSLLKAQGAHTILLHIGSWNDPSMLKQSGVINGIYAEDISVHGTNHIFKVLKKIQPDVVVTLNTNYIMDRVVCLSCRLLKIRTVFMMHGDRVVDDQVIQKLLSKDSQSLWKKTKKASKYLKLTVPNYLNSLWNFDKSRVFNFAWLSILYQTFKHPQSYYPSNKDELIQDKCLVYANKYLNYYHEKIGYELKKIEVIGNPKHERIFSLLANNGFDVAMLPASVQGLVKAQKKYLLYIEDAFVEQQNSAGWTVEFRNDFIRDVATALKLQGYELVIKLHPCTLINTVLAPEEVLVFQKEDVDSLMFFSSGCIGFTSTVLTNCLLLDKPLFTPRWGKELPQIESEFLKKGVANAWMDLKDPVYFSINTAARENFFHEAISVNTTGSCQRICEIILE